MGGQVRARGDHAERWSGWHETPTPALSRVRREEPDSSGPYATALGIPPPRAPLPRASPTSRKGGGFAPPAGRGGAGIGSGTTRSAPRNKSPTIINRGITETWSVASSISRMKP